MTREEEIIKASQMYASYQQKPFLDGAKWADEHPRKGFVNIDKACEWWKEEFYYPSMTPEEIKWYNNKVNKFRKAMEE